MLIKVALLAALLSEPMVDIKLIDMSYEPCAEMYDDYIKTLNKDRISGKVMGENLKYLCTPVKHIR